MERERDLVAALRAELAAIEPTRACCRRAERAGLGDAALGRARSPAVARLAVRLDDTNERPSSTEPGFDWSRAAEHCRMAWLRGRFLACGSLSLTPGGAHLEFVLPIGDAEVLAARLEEAGMGAASRVRRGRGVVTWKGQERMLTFLRRAGATAATLEFESRGVTRALQGQLNRVLNAEGANLLRAVVTANRQVAAIDALAASGKLGRMSAFDQAVARLRREEPGQSLTEMAAALAADRGRVQRALGRLEAAAERSDGEDAAARGIGHRVG